MFQLKKSSIIHFGIIIVLVLAIAIFAYSEMDISKKPWSVVYLTTGEIYVGKISHFPKFQISGDAYLLQVVKKQEEGSEEIKTSFQLTPIKEALWAPKKLYLNSDQVVFYGPVLETSKVAEAIRGAQ